MTEETKSEVGEESTEALGQEESTEEADPYGLASGEGDDFKWYIAKTLTGQESKIAKSLKERIVNYKLQEFFSDILVPEETVVSNAGGKKRTYKRKFFPGYVLIKMSMNRHSLAFS